MMNKLALYVFPLGVVVGGPFLPVAIILYWFANNIWTFGQQHYVFNMIEKEDEAKKQEVLQRRAANAPQPGAKPKRKATPASGNGSSTAGDDTASRRRTRTVSAARRGGAPDKPDTTGGSEWSGNRTPRPGARPKKRKR